MKGLAPTFNNDTALTVTVNLAEPMTNNQEKSIISFQVESLLF